MMLTAVSVGAAMTSPDGATRQAPKSEVSLTNTVKPVRSVTAAISSAIAFSGVRSTSSITGSVRAITCPLPRRDSTIGPRARRSRPGRRRWCRRPRRSPDPRRRRPGRARRGAKTAARSSRRSSYTVRSTRRGPAAAAGGAGGERRGLGVTPTTVTRRLITSTGAARRRSRRCARRPRGTGRGRHPSTCRRRPARQGHRDVEGLALVAHVRRAPKRVSSIGARWASSQRAGVVLERGELLLQRGRRQFVGARVERLDRVALDVGDERSECAQACPAWAGRSPAHADLAREQERVGRAGAAVGQHREVARVDPAAGHQRHQLRLHVRRRDLEHAGGGRRRVEPQRLPRVASARSASAGSSGRRPPRNVSGRIIPSCTYASVTAARCRRDRSWPDRDPPPRCAARP